MGLHGFLPGAVALEAAMLCDCCLPQLEAESVPASRTKKRAAQGQCRHMQRRQSNHEDDDELEPDDGDASEEGEGEAGGLDPPGSPDGQQERQTASYLVAGGCSVPHTS